MPRVRYRLLWALVGVLCWVMFMVAERASDQVSPWTRAALHPPLPFTSPPGDPIQEKNFTCSADDSVPSHLSQQFQEFLRYSHCRAFPTLLSPSPCENDLYLLLAVKSTAAQVERRSALRDTWGQAGRVQGRRVKLVFLLARSHDQVHGHNIQTQLERENRRYADILQWDFMDVFFNLTRKEIGFLSWFSRECRSAQFAFKGDDDVFVNTENLVEFLKAHKPGNHLFTGYIHMHGGPSRDTTSKYFIPVDIYPNETYPPFPSGGGYLMSRQTVLDLHVTAQQITLYPLDDVFVAFCLHKMGFTPTHHDGFLTFGFSHGQNYYNPCAYRDIMVLHQMSSQYLRTMWPKIKTSVCPVTVK
ncbi:N-acetyllactosaminide beta-1,3-N-acetylglucosaminyltransferase 4-like [Sardina pilchardus]|uniref:N-acetyllactosaminide beta-1,3-N-acetylglucosaminyltransferase 4-like n=1 Tax=Sardina pilchardus TaxID=27697 RepID=UPI002E0FD435